MKEREEKERVEYLKQLEVTFELFPVSLFNLG
jgi:hypothetical protein